MVIIKKLLSNDWLITSVLYTIAITVIIIRILK